MNEIGFFLEYDNELIQFPVNPETISITRSTNNTTTEVITLGEINLLRTPKLRELSWESFFPYYNWFGAIQTGGQFREPDFYAEFIEKIIDDAKPARLIITGIGVSMKVSIEKWEYEHRGGEHEDKYYTITLKEYRDYAILKTSPLNNNTLRTPNNPSPIRSTAETSVPISPTEITIGCEVLLTGTVHRDSYGNAPGRSYSNYRGRINYINKNGSHPYHVTTPDGGFLGWITSDSLQLVV